MRPPQPSQPSQPSQTSQPLRWNGLRPGAPARVLGGPRTLQVQGFGAGGVGGAAGAVPTLPIYTPLQTPHSRGSSVANAPLRVEEQKMTEAKEPKEPRELPRELPKELPKDLTKEVKDNSQMTEPLLDKMEKAELDAAESMEESKWPWIRSGLLATAGVVLWVFPERWASVILLLLALLVAPHLGPALRGGVALPHVGLRRMIAAWLLDFGFGVGSAMKDQERIWKPKLDEALAPDSDFSKGINKYALRIAENLGHAVLHEKSQWIPPVVDAVGDVVPPALSRVMERKEEWTPALTELVGDVVPSVMRGVLSNHRTWSPALMQLVGEVVPPVLSSVLRNKAWTPALLEFVGEVVPVVISVVLRRPELPPAIAAFVDASGPTLAPAVVRLIDFIIMDPQLMAAIRKMTNSSMRDEALVNNIKTVIEESLKEGSMYRAVGHGVMAAAEQSMEKMKGKAKSAVFGQ